MVQRVVSFTKPCLYTWCTYAHISRCDTTRCIVDIPNRVGIPSIASLSITFRTHILFPIVHAPPKSRSHRQLRELCNSITRIFACQRDADQQQQQHTHNIRAATPTFRSDVIKNSHDTFETTATAATSFRLVNTKRSFSLCTLTTMSTVFTYMERAPYLNGECGVDRYVRFTAAGYASLRVKRVAQHASDAFQQWLNVGCLFSRGRLICSGVCEFGQIYL